MFAALILITLAAVLPAVLVLWVKALGAGAIKLFNLLKFFSHLSSFVFCISSSLTSSAFPSFAFYIFLISQLSQCLRKSSGAFYCTMLVRAGVYRTQPVSTTSDQNFFQSHRIQSPQIPVSSSLANFKEFLNVYFI